MLHEEIVKAGYANLITYPPNLKYQEGFLKAHREARDKGRIEHFISKSRRKYFSKKRENHFLIFEFSND